MAAGSLASRPCRCQARIKLGSDALQLELGWGDMGPGISSFPAMAVTGR